MNPQTPSAESAYQADLRISRNQAHAQEQQNQLLNEQRADVETCIPIGRKIVRLKSSITDFDNPSSDFSARVMDAKNSRKILLMTWAIIILIANTDFWLATPDLAEMLAHKCTSMVGNGNALVTPTWLKVLIGLMISIVFIAVTYVFKWVTNVQPEKEAIMNLQAGDHDGYRQHRNSRNRKYFGKFFYMTILATAFYALFQFDMERARQTAELKNLLAAEEEISTSNFSMGLEEESINTDNHDKAPVSESQDHTFIMAIPALVIYSTIWLLHGLLMIVPHSGVPQDSHLAKFNRGKAENYTAKLEDEQESRLRSVLFRINENNGELQQALIREALPLGHAINKAAGREVMEVSDSNTNNSDIPQMASPPQEQASSNSYPEFTQDYPENHQSSPSEEEGDVMKTIFG